MVSRFTLVCLVPRYGHHQRGHRGPPDVLRQGRLDSCHTEHRWHHGGCDQREGKRPYHANHASQLIQDGRGRSNRALISPLCAGGGRGGAGGVSRPFLGLHGRRAGRAHVCLHHGHGEPALPVSHFLVRPQRGLSVWGRAGSMCGELIFVYFTRERKIYKRLKEDFIFQFYILENTLFVFSCQVRCEDCS